MERVNFGVFVQALNRPAFGLDFEDGLMRSGEICFL